jgi:hypothetical protein
VTDQLRLTIRRMHTGDVFEVPIQPSAPRDGQPRWALCRPQTVFRGDRVLITNPTMAPIVCTSTMTLTHLRELDGENVGSMALEGRRYD